MGSDFSRSIDLNNEALQLSHAGDFAEAEKMYKESLRQARGLHCTACAASLHTKPVCEG